MTPAALLGAARAACLTQAVAAEASRTAEDAGTVGVFECAMPDGPDSAPRAWVVIIGAAHERSSGRLVMPRSLAAEVLTRQDGELVIDWTRDGSGTAYRYVPRRDAAGTSSGVLLAGAVRLEAGSVDGCSASRPSTAAERAAMPLLLAAPSETEAPALVRYARHLIQPVDDLDALVSAHDGDAVRLRPAECLALLAALESSGSRRAGSPH